MTVTAENSGSSPSQLAVPTRAVGDELSPDERLDRAAQIFAQAIRRLIAAVPPPPAVAVVEDTT